jgi:hypothetical protein
VDEGNSSAPFGYGHNKIIVGAYDSNSSPVSTTSTSYLLQKTFNFITDKNVTHVLNEISNQNSYTTSCYINFIYSDGTQLGSITHSTSSTTYSSFSYPNPETSKLVSGLQVFIKTNSSYYNRKAQERNTIVFVSNQIYNISYSTLNIPQYSEQNVTHFRVKVDETRQGDDDIWFELVNEDNSTKTYTNADFDKLLPIQSPIVKPTRLRIYMKPASSGATIGGTGVSAVYWGTSNPKSLWTATQRVDKDIYYSENTQKLTRRSWRASSEVQSFMGFRLVRRP